MSNAPSPVARQPAAACSYGERGLPDALDKDALVCGFDGISMGAATERTRPGWASPGGPGCLRRRVARQGFRRDQGGAAGGGDRAGHVEGRKGDVVVEQDEGVRPGTTARTARPGFSPRSAEGGTITAGSASQLSDGACAVVVMSREPPQRAGLAVAGRDRRLRHRRGTGPLAAAPARQRDQATRCAATAPLRSPAWTSIEINEAFAGVALASTRDLGLSARQGQRQRRGHRSRSSGRHERRPACPQPRVRAAAARRRDRRRRAVRRRRPGRRPHPPRPSRVARPCPGRLGSGFR